jgi:Lsr2
MAKKVYVQLVDDIDDEPIESGGEHISYAVNGIGYEIDLSDKNAKEFHRKLDYYIAHSERVGNRRASTSVVRTPVARTSGGDKRDASHTRAVRDWAKANGYAISTRGRIPSDVEKAFDAAH